MPPKTKNSPSSLSTEDIHELKTQLDNGPSVGDYNKLLSCVNGDEKVRYLASQLIPKYHKSFPKLSKEVFSSLKKLVNDSNADTQVYALRALEEFADDETDEMSEVLLPFLSSDVELLKTNAVKIVNKLIQNNESYKSKFISLIGKQEPDTQEAMIEIAMDKFEFNEDNKDQLIQLVGSCFNSSVVHGLKLMRKNLSLIDEKKREELNGKLFDNLRHSLKTDFSDVAGTLLIPIMKFAYKLEIFDVVFDILVDQVFPRFDDLDIETKIKILQIIADEVKSAKNSRVLEALYKNVYLKFPVTYNSTTKVNFSLLEAGLYSFFKLARKFSHNASELTGQLLVISGQPNENEGLAENPEKTKEFLSRLENLDVVAEKFVEFWKNKQDTERERINKLPENEQKKEKVQISIAIRTGNNVRHFCRILQKSNFPTEKPPKDVSWRKPRSHDNKSGGKFGKGRNFRGYRRDGERYRDDRQRGNNDRYGGYRRDRTRERFSRHYRN